MRGPRSKGQLAKLNTSGVFVHDKLDHNYKLDQNDKLDHNRAK